MTCADPGKLTLSEPGVRVVKHHCIYDTYAKKPEFPCAAALG